MKFGIRFIYNQKEGWVKGVLVVSSCSISVFGVEWFNKTKGIWNLITVLMGGVHEAQNQTESEHRNRVGAKLPGRREGSGTPQPNPKSNHILFSNQNNNHLLLLAYNHIDSHISCPNLIN